VVKKHVATGSLFIADPLEQDNRLTIERAVAQGSRDTYTAWSADVS
jgi:hypothetical protein